MLELLELQLLRYAHTLMICMKSSRNRHCKSCFRSCREMNAQIGKRISQSLVVNLALKEFFGKNWLEAELTWKTIALTALEKLVRAYILSRGQLLSGRLLSQIILPHFFYGLLHFFPQ